MKKWILLFLGIALAIGTLQAGKKPANPDNPYVHGSNTVRTATSDQETFLFMGPGYDPAFGPGESGVDYYYELFVDDFEWYSATFERCCNFWETYAIIDFDEIAAPAATLYHDGLTEDESDMVGWNGTLHAYDMSLNSADYENSLLPEGFVLQEVTELGDSTNNLEVLALQFSDTTRGYHFVSFVIENDGTADLTNGSITLFADIDAAEGWWPDEQYQEYGDDWDAYLYNLAGQGDELVYQYFNPAVVDTNDDGTSDYPSWDPVFYAGISHVAGADSVNMGLIEDWWTNGSFAAFSEALEGYYDYDAYYETTPTDLAGFLTLYFGDLAVGAQKQVTFALVGGESAADIEANAAEAKLAWAGQLGTGEDIAGAVPNQFQLQQNYPNPFNPTTVVPFEMREAGQVRMEIFDVNGTSLKTLMRDIPAAGNYEMNWDGTTSLNEAAPSGIYLYRLTLNGISQTRKMALIR